jgi:WD repeat-containing protein 7
MGHAQWIVDYIRSLLSVLLTPGLNDEIDRTCRERLSIASSVGSIGFSRYVQFDKPRGLPDLTLLTVWVPPLYTAQLQCRIIGASLPTYPQLTRCPSSRFLGYMGLWLVRSSVRSYLAYAHIGSEFSEDYNAVVAFYATSLAPAVGPSYQPPSLPFLARCWLESPSKHSTSHAHSRFSIVPAQTRYEMGLASSLMLEFLGCPTKKPTSWWKNGSTIVRFSLCNRSSGYIIWAVSVPCLQPDADREAMRAGLALFLCGYIASEKYTLFSAR